jgi:hypothetical protein
MKNKLLNLSGLLFVVYFLLSVKTPSPKITFKIIEPIVVKSIDTVCVEENYIPDNFTIIYNSFKNYNPYVDSITALRFTDVVNCFGLNDSVTVRWSIGQILLESGAKQYYQPTHPKEGKLVVSSAGAIGFTQILPSTAYGYMIKKISEEDKECFKELGATDFSFAYNKRYSKTKKINMTRVWLMDENNNMVMWGKIMSSKLKDKPIVDALITYNAGSGGLNRYVSSGRPKIKHKYIRGIKERLSKVGL